MVQGQGGLVDKATPKVQRRSRVAADDASDQMVLEGMYGTLFRVCLVQVGGYKLKRDSLAANIIL